MKRLVVLSSIMLSVLSISCVSKKKYAALQSKYDNSQSALYKTKTEKQECEDKMAKIQQRVSSYYAKISSLQDENENKLSMTGDGAVISENDKKSMRKTLKNVDQKKLANAKTLSDSIDLAVSYNLKKSLANGNDDDIDISVNKTVVQITISDKLLFRSGSYRVNSRANELLGRIAKVVNSEPAMEVMVEGNTDSRTLKKKSYIQDNWDLSVRRATSVVRILQDKYNVDGKQLIAAGRSSYMPIADNDTKAGREKNRRTRIVILPNLNKFLAMLQS